MSVNHSSFLGIGLRMYSEEEVKEFLLEHSKLDDRQQQVIAEGWDIQDALYQYGSAIAVECLDCYSRDDWFVGFRVGKTQEAEELSDNVHYAADAWRSEFPNEEARVIWAVVYS